MKILALTDLRPGSPPFCTAEVEDNGKKFKFDGIPCFMGSNGWQPSISSILDRLEEEDEKAERGFTIIELLIAIVLIFIVVFIILIILPLLWKLLLWVWS